MIKLHISLRLIEKVKYISNFLEIIENLPKISEDPLFNQLSLKNAQKGSSGKFSQTSPREIKSLSKSANFIEKSTWFSTKKDNTAEIKDKVNTILIIIDNDRHDART